MPDLPAAPTLDDATAAASPSMASASASATSASADSTASEAFDLTSSPYSLHRAVYARRKEYVRPHRMQVKIGTWNVAASPGTDKDLASWFISGKGVDKRLASLNLTNIASSPAFERQNTSESLDNDPNAVRLVGGDKIGLYVLGLQEVVDLNAATQYMNRAVYTTPAPGAVDRWKMAMEAALPPGYQLVAAEHMSGLLLLVYASPDVAPAVTNVSSSSVGTGLLGYLGNKGAVATRIVLGETTRMIFFNCHLASGSETTNLERRCWDVAQIASRAEFEPVSLVGAKEYAPEKLGDEDFAFWFGDLNFRIDGLPGDDIRRLLMLHTRGEYTIGDPPAEAAPLDGEDAIVLRNSESSDDRTDQDSVTSSTARRSDETFVTLPDPDEFLPDPSEDPASLQATLDSLLPHDQLRRMMRERKVFQEGWREGPITFLPSYKYDVGTVGLFDSSEKRRAPSWCDRILFRTRKDREHYEQIMKEEEVAKKRDQEMTARGIDHAADEDEVLFDYDPDNERDEPPTPRSASTFDYDEGEDGLEESSEAEQVLTREGFVDRIHLDIYTSHQRIQSSDHKPIISIFTLDYDAVVAELKAKVLAEVARELDRAENEGRPGITIVVDAQYGESARDGGPSEGAVDFGTVEFLRKRTCSLTIANTGRVSATFSFVEKPTTGAGDEADEAQPPSWLSTTFARSNAELGDGSGIDLGKEVTLEPGETVMALLEVLVDDLAHVRMLNGGRAVLEDVLVLRVADGRDHFILARASWSPTCIGRSIEELIRVPDGGIRRFARSLSEGKLAGGFIPYDLEVHCAAPKELFKLLEAVESLAERALADEQMLQKSVVPRDQPAWPWERPTREVTNEQLARVVRALDEDSRVNDALDAEMPSAARLEVVSRALLLFLNGLTDGVVSAPLWARIEQASLASLAPGASPSQAPSEEEDKTAILDVLASAPNRNIAFVFLTTTMAKVISELSPLSRADVAALKGSGRGMVSMGRRSLSFRRAGAAASGDALAALDRRQAREKHYAEVLGRAACRGPPAAKEKERKALEEKQRALLHLFLRRPLDEGE